MSKSYAELVREALRVVAEVTPDEAFGLFEDGAEVVFVDVREAEEVRRGTIPHSIVIPRGILESHIRDTIPQKDLPIVLVCAVGNRSALAGKTLLEMGYTNVRSLAGGMRAWAMAGHPMAPPAFA